MRTRVLRGIVTNAPIELTNSTIFGVRLPDGKPIVVFTRDLLATQTDQTIKLGNKVLVVGSYPKRNRVCFVAEAIGLDILFGINVQMDLDEITNVGGSFYDSTTDNTNEK
jgi:hypothetical protein